MIYEVVATSPDRLVFQTHPRARRGRGILFATAPWVVYLLAVGAVFALALQDLSLFERMKQFALWGVPVAAIFSALAFALGRRVHERFRCEGGALHIERAGVVGTVLQTLPFSELSGWSVEPAVRSLGADLALIARTRDGRRLPVAEGEPHSGQLREIAAIVARISGLPLG